MFLARERIEFGSSLVICWNTSSSKEPKSKLWPAFFNKCSNELSLFTIFNPVEVSDFTSGVVLKTVSTTADLPAPGPPAKNTAFKIPGSYTPSTRVKYPLRRPALIRLSTNSTH